MQSPFHRDPEQILQRQIQKKKVSGVPLSGRDGFTETSPGLGDCPDHVFDGPVPVLTRLNVPDETLKVTVQERDGRLYRGMEIGARMDLLEDRQKLSKIVEQRFLQIADEIGVRNNGPFIASQAFLGDPSGFQGRVKTIQIAVVPQEFEICFADHDVVGGRIVVKLLVPFFHEMAGDFLDMVAMHNMEDLVADPLPLAASSQGGQHEPDKPAALRFRDVQPGDFVCQSVQCVRQLPWFGVEVALPVQLSDGGKTKPHKNKGHAVCRARGPVEKIMAQIETVHEGPGMVPRFSFDDGVGHIGKDRIAEKQVASGSWHTDPVVPPPVVVPTVLRREIKDKRNGKHIPRLFQVNGDFAFAVVTGKRGLDGSPVKRMGSRRPG